MSYSVIFSPEAEEQLVGLYRYVAKAASSETAKEFTDAIIKHCEELKSFPQRGTLREDIRPGLRITHFKKRTIIAFAIMDENVVILSIYYGGQNFEEKLNDDAQL
ncbi:type II toxin-antitoxin system RelE/ParE family toxin [Maridesulfovibrio sp.]|uniref:type II toxin-antitoxin system RelE/ParE family toxin n=1 Tax=Maridesulfovibrio sp. TaxID=2795000 RepID=UPI0029CA1AC9|nr:type II toxin-antitoxin system RelE/ParE family toxin [Maridesulfovibrio sp.]